jgi:hypothetical protein
LQFQVPQNIDLEDKIVGPLTLIQFLYVLGGALIDYFLFQALGQDYFSLFLVAGIPIALISLSLAFFKIQDQPLSHFISVGLVYMTKPKLRLWSRQTNFSPILTAPPKKEENEIVATPKHHLEKSELEQLAYDLDVNRPTPAETKKRKFGAVTSAFEQILKEQPTGQVKGKK